MMAVCWAVTDISLQKVSRKLELTGPGQVRVIQPAVRGGHDSSNVAENTAKTRPFCAECAIFGPSCVWISIEIVMGRGTPRAAEKEERDEVQLSQRLWCFIYVYYFISFFFFFGNSAPAKVYLRCSTFEAPRDERAKGLTLVVNRKPPATAYNLQI